jgi:hypothetical protein
MTLIPALLAVVIWLLVTFGLAPRGEDAALLVTSAIGWQFALSAVVALVALRFMEPQGRNRAKSPRSSLALLILPLSFCATHIAIASEAGLPSSSVLSIIAVNAVLIGVSEEVMFRGVLLGALRQRLSLWIAIVVSSLLFGLVHVANVLLTGNLKIASLQAVSAFLLGMFFAILRLRTGALWPPIVIHVLWNAGLMLMTTTTTPLSAGTPFLPLLFVVLLGLYASVLWRGAERD